MTKPNAEAAKMNIATNETDHHPVEMPQIEQVIPDSANKNTGPQSDSTARYFGIIDGVTASYVLGYN